MNAFSKIIILSLSLVLFYSCETKAQKGTISASEFEQKSKDSKQILDVRTLDEYNTGHIPNALQADWTQRAQFAERVNNLDKNKPVFVYCLSGGRSNAAMDWLSSQGFKEVYNLEGGIPQWKAANFPVETPKEEPQITKEQFDQSIQGKGKVLVDVGAVWCPPCQKMKPIVKKLEDEGQKVVYVDGNSQNALCDMLGVENFPTFIVFQDGKELKRFEGITSYDDLKNSMK